MHTVAVIPARYGSQRLPAKPLLDIGGKPMIQHVYERAAQATRVQDVVVATDDERIASAVKSFGGKCLMTPAHVRSGTDRVAHAARDIEADIIVNLQGDEPLIPPAMVNEAVEILLQHPEAGVGTLVRRIETTEELLSPAVVKVVLDVEGRCLYFSRSPIPHVRDVEQGQWLGKATFFKHIGLYVFRRKMLMEYAAMAQTPAERTEKLEQLRILEHGFTIRAVVTHHDSIPVDTAADLDRVRDLVRRAS